MDVQRLGAASMPGRWRGREAHPECLNMSTRHVEAIRLRYRAGGGGFNARQVARQETLALSLEGVSQMVYILPERLLALVRPAFDLVLEL